MVRIAGKEDKGSTYKTCKSFKHKRLFGHNVFFYFEVLAMLWRESVEQHRELLHWYLFSPVSCMFPADCVLRWPSLAPLRGSRYFACRLYSSLLRVSLAVANHRGLPISFCMTLPGFLTWLLYQKNAWRDRFVSNLHSENFQNEMSWSFLSILP